MTDKFLISGLGKEAKLMTLQELKDYKYYYKVYSMRDGREDQKLVDWTPLIKRMKRNPDSINGLKLPRGNKIESQGRKVIETGT